MVTNTTRSSSTELRLDAEVSNEELLQSFNFPSSNLKLIFETSSEKITRSRGMVSIQNRIVSLNDIYRVLQAATNIISTNGLIFQVGNNCLFEIDHNPLMSINSVIGHYGNLLTVQIKTIEIPSIKLNLIRELCDTHKHRIEEVMVDEIN